MLLNGNIVNHHFQEGLHIVNGNFERPSILITMPGGTMADPAHQIGLAHFCEHVLVHMLLGQVENTVIEDGFDYLAYTDYSHIVLYLSVENEPGYFQRLVEAIHSVMKFGNVTRDMINSSREEVLKEIDMRKYELQQLANQYDSVNGGKGLPLLTGTAESVKNISHLDIGDYIKALWNHVDIAGFYNIKIHKDVNVTLLNNKNSPSENRVFDHKRQEEFHRTAVSALNLIACQEKRNLSLQITETIVNNQRHKLFQMIHELMVIDCLGADMLALEWTFSQKSFTAGQYIRMAKIRNAEWEKIRYKLEGPSIPLDCSEVKFEKHKNNIHHLLQSFLDNLQMDSSFVTDSLLRHLKYGDLLLLNCEDIYEIDRVVGSLTYGPYKEFCETNYPTEMKVIKT